jgi:hypothetical protein
VTVDLAGSYPDDRDEDKGVHVVDDMAVTDAVCRTLASKYASEEDQVKGKARMRWGEELQYVVEAGAAISFSCRPTCPIRKSMPPP